MRVMQLSIGLATIIIYSHAYNDLAARLARDIQTELDSDWLIILISSDKGRTFANQNFLKLRKNPFLLMSVLTLNDFGSLNTENIISRSPIIFFSLSITQNLKEFLDTVSSHKPGLPFFWFVLTEENILDRLKNIYIPFDSQFIICRKSFELENLELVEVYKTSEVSELFLNFFGTWNPDIGLNLTSKTFLERRMNFHEEKLIIHNPTDTAGGTLINLPRFLPFEWGRIADRLNITSVYSESGKFDVSIFNHLIIGDPGFGYVYFQPMFCFEVHLLYRDVEEEINLKSYLAPFSSTVWITTIFWIISISSFATFIRTRIIDSKNSKISKLIHSHFDTLTILLQQDILPLTNLDSEKILTGFALILSMVLFGFYSAIFVSFVTVKNYKVPFDELSLEGVSRQGEYKIWLVRTKMYPFFKNSRHSIFQKLFKEQVLPFEDQPKTFTEAYEKFCYTPGKYLLEYNPDDVNHLNTRFNCRVSHNTIFINTFYITWIVKKNLPFRPTLEFSLMKQIESGINLKVFRMKAYPQMDEESHFLNPISIGHVIPLFAVHGFGLTLGILILLIELRAAGWK